MRSKPVFQHAKLAETPASSAVRNHGGEMDVAGNRTLYSVFAASAARHPERTWLIYERDDRQVFSWTYGEFLDGVHRAANLLRSLGIGPGDVFNLHLSNHPAYPQLILAASYLGATEIGRA